MSKTKGYCDLIHKSIKDLETSNQFSDITLQVQGKKFPCHKFILSATSPYFHAMFTSSMKESKKKVIQLPFLNVKTFETVRHFIYSGYLETDSSLESVELLEAANFLQMELLQKECEDKIKVTINHQSVLKVWQLGKKISTKLENNAFAYICRHFIELMADKQLLDISVEELSEILNSEELILPNEDVASELILSWLTKDFATRKQYLEEVLPLLRLPFSSAEYLFQRIEKQYPDIANLPIFQPYFIEAQNYHKFPARQADFSSNSTRQRPTSIFTDVVILVNGSSDISALTLDDLAWHSLSQIPRDKGKDFAMCTNGDSTLLMSGGTMESRSILRYTGTSNKWNAFAQRANNKTFRSLTNHAMICYGDSAYMLGGEVMYDYSEAVPCKKVYRWKLATDDWSVSGKLVNSVYNPTAVVNYSSVLIVGKTKKENAGEENVIQIYDTTLGCTTVITNKPSIGGLEKIIGFNDKVFGLTDDKVIALTVGSGDIEFKEEVVELAHGFIHAGQGVRKIDDRIIFLESHKAGTADNPVVRNIGLFCNIVTHKCDVKKCTDSRLSNLLPMCFRIIVKKSYLGTANRLMFSSSDQTNQAAQ